MKLFDMLTNSDIQRIKAQGDLGKRVKELEDKCREAGRTMIELNLKYESALKEVDRLSEENTNLKTMMKGTDGSDNNS